METYMKLCSMCKINKSLAEYAKKRTKKNGEIVYQYHCKQCQKTYSDEHYKQNKTHYINLAKERKSSYKQEMFSFLIEYFRKNMCVDCGESNPIVLEFDHVRGKKLNNISTMMMKMLPREVIMDEIEKCEVRCANCHRIKTAERGNWKMLHLLHPDNSTG